jgi:hypothetical protein
MRRVFSLTLSPPLCSLFPRFVSARGFGQSRDTAGPSIGPRTAAAVSSWKDLAITRKISLTTLRIAYPRRPAVPCLT